jgi:hypothetical protein
MGVAKGEPVPPPAGYGNAENEDKYSDSRKFRPVAQFQGEGRKVLRSQNQQGVTKGKYGNGQTDDPVRSDQVFFSKNRLERAEIGNEEWLGKYQDCGQQTSHLAGEEQGTVNSHLVPHGR